MLCSLLTLGDPRTATAATASEESARAFYEQGVAYSERGDLDLALEAFERAHRTLPLSAVLFNIGQLQYSLGKLVAAKQTLERYLREGGASKTSETIAQANRTLEQCNRRIGRLTVNVKPTNARVYLDGALLDGSPVALPIQGGHHAIVAIHDGHQPAFSAFEVEGGNLTAIELALTPNDAPKGWLKLDCPVPDATAYLGNEPINAANWKQLIPLREQSTALRFVRVGYTPAKREIIASPGQVVSVSCDLRPLDRLTAQQRGSLVLRTQPSNSEVLIDGTPFRFAAVPVGRHRIEVRHPGYVADLHELTIGSTQEVSLEVKLKPTPELQRRLELQAQRQRTFSYAVGSVGLALEVGALAAYLINRGRYGRWQSDRDQVAAGGSNASQWAELAERAASIQRLDDYALAGAMVGTALLTTSIYYLIKGQESSSW